MTSSDPGIKVEQSPRYGKSRFLLASLFLWTTAALASGPGPNGVNVGFDFNWNNGPAGYAASFIGTTSGSGATLVNCTNGGGPVTPSSSVCDFVFAYSIGGTAQTPVSSGGVYETYPTGPAAPNNCDVSPRTTAPLTLFNCFNTNSFGQVFLASATGALSDFSMNLTCLNPAGTPVTGLSAVIYQVNSNGTIPATPLGSIPVDLSTCPTLTSWSGHVFSSGDFATIPLNFNNVTLTAGNFYAVYFSGLVPGSPLPGSPLVTSVTPSTGPPTGGNTVTITGTGFTGATSVTFGGVAATSFTVVNDTTITSVVPSGSTSGAVSVIVTTGVGSNAANALYSYVIATPTLSEWGMIAFAGLLVLFAIFKLRRVDKSATA